ncbi:peptidyl-tRNA hydrolase 2, mitochondrial [Hylaeus anthracinus]|uniref:peptidyl-tRNA hydrolase 2, mitochondrial n=1 Tax=Hylaeus anthracinus TaxID=313031 RepID=UPI0023B9FE28|nr:peptidyl-tRNA hydrolase 2, mitochondrial [Hylaeus anthracinus]
MSAILNYVKRLCNYTLKYSNIDCKMIIVVRSDIAMGKGKTAAQCAHAAVECYRIALNNVKHKQVLESWLLSGQPKIVVGVPNEERLLSIARSAHKVGLICAIIKDAGRTQLQPGTISVLGIGPGPKEVIDNITSKLKLV